MFIRLGLLVLGAVMLSCEESVTLKEQEASLLCLNVYDSRIPAVTSNLKEISWATIELPDSDRTISTRVFGDGSFFVRIPSRQKVYITLKDKEGNVVASDRHGLMVEPGRTAACMGCHEMPGRTPENRVPMAVQRVSK